jgi:exosortase/archaeosortase family protein
MQVLTLFLLLLRPTRMFQRVTLLALVTLLTPFANVMRLVTMGLLAQVRPEWATRLHDTNSWAFTLLLFGLMCWLAHRLGIVGSEGATANESEGHTKDEGQGLAHPSSFIPHPWSPRAGWGEVRRLAGLGLLLLLTCVLGFEIDARVGKGGEWLPQVPASFSGWQGREHAMEWTFVDEERYLSRVYTNGFGEAVQAFVIAPRSGYGYRDPRGCLRGSGYFVTAERLVDLGEGGEGRELVLCNDAGAQMVMCYWQQGRGGWVRAEAPVFAYHSGTQALTELRMVGEALLHPKPSCLVRVYAPFGTEDPQGRQAQRNVLAVSREVYRSIRPQGR